MNKSRRVVCAMAASLGLAGAMLAWPAAAQAQLRVGQTAGLTGAVAATVKEATAGARLAFAQVNAQGGIGGQKVELVQLDDRFEPEQAAANARKLADEGVISLFLTRGTPHNQAILPVLAQAKLPLVGPSTGAMLLHQPVNPWVYNVRASYQREAERIVRHLVQVGVSRLAIVQVADSFGDAAAAGALRGFGATLKPVAHLKYDRSKPDFAPVVKQLLAADAQAVLFLGSGTAVVDGIKALRAAGSAAQLATLSNNASAGFVKSLGPLAHGVIVSQVLPSERALAVPLVKEAHDLVAQYPQLAGEVTPALLEGYASAKVLLEGLRRAAAARDLTRTGLQRALDGLTRYNLGGLELSYSASDHSGLDYADLSIVGADGRFKR
ncbi:ABC transporter substrate-binding protein [Ideonella sp. DXS22W]|uniref:ABC transporter substrate-binding protein n=1 Tax=Pseudaquabacterium inlustre TaxID=2984192 RepID=A0ABU9CCA7_9BURK